MKLVTDRNLLNKIADILRFFYGKAGGTLSVYVPDGFDGIEISFRGRSFRVGVYEDDKDFFFIQGDCFHSVPKQALMASTN